jgi:KAP family P-loop domain
VVVDQPGLLFFDRGLANPIRVALQDGATPTHVSWIDNDQVLVATAEGNLITVHYSDAVDAAASRSSSSGGYRALESEVISAPIEESASLIETFGFPHLVPQRDSPTATDLLGRSRFRDSLAQSIVELTTGEGTVPIEFPAILVGGQWGSGKSSVLKKFEEERQTGDANRTAQELDWKFAHFNAWTNEHLADPAAGLLKSLRQSVAEGMNPAEQFGFRARELMIRFFGDQGAIPALFAFVGVWFVGLLILGVAKKPLAAIGIPATVIAGMKWIGGARNVVIWDRFRAASLRSDRFISGLTETKRLARWYRNEAHRSIKPRYNRRVAICAGVAFVAGLSGWAYFKPSIAQFREPLQANWWVAFALIFCWVTCLSFCVGKRFRSKNKSRVLIGLVPYFAPLLLVIFWIRSDGGLSNHETEGGRFGLLVIGCVTAALWQVLVLASWQAPSETPKSTPRGRIFLFVVDDLDRCAHAKVVELLSLLNTVFQQNDDEVTTGERPHNRFCVVVLGDDGWIADAYTKAMKDSSDDHDVGWSFVAKLFDLVVRVPSPSKEAMISMIETQLARTSHDRASTGDGAASSSTSPASNSSGSEKVEAPSASPSPKSTTAEPAGATPLGTKSSGSSAFAGETFEQTNQAQADTVAKDDKNKEEDRDLIRHFLTKEVQTAHGNPRAIRRAIALFEFWKRLEIDWQHEERVQLAQLAMKFASEPAKAGKCCDHFGQGSPTSPIVWGAIGGRLACHKPCDSVGRQEGLAAAEE